MKPFRLHPLVTLIVFCLPLYFLSCNGSSTDPEDDDTPARIEKSFKRGLSYDLRHAEDLDTLKGAVSWWYNWYFQTQAPEGYYADYQMEFIPMLWGGNPSIQDVSAVKSFILDHPEIDYLLVMNEPNLTDQVNMLPEHAAASWLVYEQIIADLGNQGREIKLVGPAMNWGTLEGYSDPLVWMDAFLLHFNNMYGRDPLIDYLAFHWYDYGLAQQLDRLQKYGLKIWITEMANWNPVIDSYAKQIQQMTEMVALCENRDDVYRYAWFIGRSTTFSDRYTFIFEDDPGELTELGEVYISLPYNTTFSGE